MKNRELNEVLKELQRLSEKDFQAIEWEMEKLRKLRQIMSVKQPQLPLFPDSISGRKYFN
jgi:hypothetical protein